MRWRTKAQRIEDRRDREISRGWHRRFAWWPVRLDGDVVWLGSYETKVTECQTSLLGNRMWARETRVK